MTATSWISEPSVEVLDLRHFTSAELRPILEEEARAWTERLLWDYHGSAEMILRYIDGKILPGYALLKDGRVAGYCFFVYEGNKGVIGDLFVASSASAGGYPEERLLKHTIETLQQSPGVRRIEAQLLQHETGSVAHPFEIHSFRRHRRLFMVYPLRGPVGKAAPPAPVLPSDIELRRWSEQDYQPAAGVITSSYRGHVDAEINDQYCSTSGSLRFLNNIVRFPGCGQFDHGASFVAVHKFTGNMVGLVLCSRVKDDVGHVTQVCVLDGQRGKHIGKALLAATANELRQRSFSALTLTVTEANKRAVGLYQELGYRVHRVFDAFVWEG